MLTDYAMLSMNGLDLATALRERGFEGPIILMSGFSAQLSEDEMEAVGITMYLREPVTSAELIQALDDVFDDGPTLLANRFDTVMVVSFLREEELGRSVELVTRKAISPHLDLHTLEDVDDVEIGD